jgi:2-dehydropantoate 2-reductase
VILFCVKTVNTETAARELQPFLSPEAAVLSFQNGVDNVESTEPDRVVLAHA